MNRGLTGASAVEANNVDESMSFFKASETFGWLFRREGRVQDYAVSASSAIVK
jgi:hypothetical protein